MLKQKTNSCFLCDVSLLHLMGDCGGMTIEVTIIVLASFEMVGIIDV